jgi:hypothetical protein
MLITQGVTTFKVTAAETNNLNACVTTSISKGLNGHCAINFSIKKSKKRIPSSHTYSPEITSLQHVNISACLS